jgi:hypothetical protein
MSGSPAWKNTERGVLTERNVDDEWLVAFQLLPTPFPDLSRTAFKGGKWIDCPGDATCSLLERSVADRARAHLLSFRLSAAATLQRVQAWLWR